METNARIAAVASVSAAPQAQPGPEAEPVARSDFEVASRYRLVIEEGPHQGTFIYKTLDSSTGEILRQFPREQLVRLAQATDYNAGSVINTKA